MTGVSVWLCEDPSSHIQSVKQQITDVFYLLIASSIFDRCSICYNDLLLWLIQPNQQLWTDFKGYFWGGFPPPLLSQKYKETSLGKRKKIDFKKTNKKCFFHNEANQIYKKKGNKTKQNTGYNLNTMYTKRQIFSSMGSIFTSFRTGGPISCNQPGKWQIYSS